MRIATNNFKGELPRIASELLPPGYAQEAINCRLLSGNLEAWKNFDFVESLCKSGVINTIYPLRNPFDIDEIFWLHWNDSELDTGAVEVDVAKSTVSGDVTGRVYLTGLDVPRWTNINLATGGSGCFPQITRPLGVINPDNAALVVATGTGGTNSVTFTDAFDDPSLWTLSSDFNTGSTVRHAEINGNGNPGNCLEVLAAETNDCAYAYRDTGAALALNTQMRFQVYCAEPATTGVWNWMAGVYRDQAGTGIILGMAFAAGEIYIGTATEWKQVVGSTIFATAVGPQPPIHTWIQLTVTIVRTQSGLCDVTLVQSSLDGATVYATAHATDVPSAGGFIGLGNDCAPGLGGERIRFDNVQFNATNILDDTSDNTATSYVYTFVSDNGDGTFNESGPSPASVTISKDNFTTVTVTTDTSPPSGLDYGVIAKRIYRAISGSSGTAFFLLAEIPIAQVDYVDTITDSAAAQGAVLPSTGWDLPPTHMRGILALPNNIYAGFHDNVLDLSAQGFGHAWPVGFRLATDFPIVGIGAIDTMVVICTEGFPYIAAGNSPDAYSMAKIELPQGCVSKRSIAYLKGVGVLYASPDGLVSVAGPGQASLVTGMIFTREEWQAFRPESMIATAHDNRYFVQYDNGTKGAFMLETTQNGFGKVALAFHATAVRADLLTDKLYLVLDENDPPSPPGSPQRSDQVVPNSRTIYAFDSYVGGSPAVSAKLPYSWTDHLNMLDKPLTFRYGRVQSRGTPVDTTMILRANGGAAYYTKAVTDQEEFALPDVANEDGADDFQYQLLGTDTIRTVQVVEGADEIR